MEFNTNQVWLSGLLKELYKQSPLTAEMIYQYITDQEKLTDKLNAEISLLTAKIEASKADLSSIELASVLTIASAIHGGLNNNDEIWDALLDFKDRIEEDLEKA